MKVERGARGMATKGSRRAPLLALALVGLLMEGAAAQDPPEQAPQTQESPTRRARPSLHEPAQPRPLVVDRVEVHDVASAVNGVDYELRVSLPHGYEEAQRRFPVVFTLDADYSFLIARNIADHLAERDHLREVMVVGIAYGGPLRYRRNRTRDYTPTFVPEGGYGAEYQKVSGGGPDFLEALEKELIPFIDRHYRTLVEDRTLVGHSYGGLFTTWTLFTRARLFHNYVIVSPSLWYDDHLILRLEEAFAQGRDSLPARAYLCVGSREGNSRIDMVGDLETLTRRLKARSYRGFRFESRVMANETHNSIFPGCLSNGLRFVLEGV